MRILALDQASRITGWAIFDGGELIEYGAIDASRYSDLGDRLYTLRNSVKNIITEFKIDKVILEDIFLDEQKVNNIQTFKVLAEVFGVLYELCKFKKNFNVKFCSISIRKCSKCNVG